VPRDDLHRGDIWWVDWSPGRGSEQMGYRPALIIQTNAGNHNPNYPNTIVATISTKGRNIPTHIRLDPSSENGLIETSYVKCEQVMTIDKARLRKHIGHISSVDMECIGNTLRRLFDL
jgi:mRNA interferase MazF